MRVSFKSARTYILGYSLENPSGKIISSAAAPFVITRPKVLGVATPATKTFTRRLSAGSRGDDVTALQNKLSDDGFYTGPVTGYFGGQTTAAVKDYQKAHGFTPLGSVGPQTLAALNQ
ncbi:MAG: peptidoglycan-binding protein [Candidatus Doudnabacteria bacterium]|nr:peptidoglycan-binding protein [Candidatus Doudnabacteria bacterium]